MADRTINDLTQAESIGSEDLFVLQQNSEAKKLKGAQLVKYAQDAVGAQVTAATQAAENAAAAKTGAESAQTEAQAAQASAESAKTAAETAKETAVLASEEAQSAIDIVDAAKTAAQTAAQTATEKATAAESAKQAAQTAQGAAEAAKADAVTSSNTATSKATEASQSAQEAAFDKQAAAESAASAEEARQAIENMLVEAITLATGQSATVSKSLVDGVVKLVFGLPAGAKGDTGEPGSSIQTIQRTNGNGAPGTTDTYTITMTDGTTSTFTVYNGSDGAGSGDMKASVYDPQGKSRDIFAYVDEMLGSAGAQVAKATLPKGRMRGDVDGDGEVTVADVVIIRNSVTGEATLDDIQTWCADANASNSITTLDATQTRRFVLADPTNPSVLTSTPTMADYYGTWTYVKVDNATGYFYTDIAVEGVTATSSAIVAVQGNHKRDAFAGAECMDGFVRVKANLLPVADATCLVFHSPGDGTAVVVPENVVDRVGVPIELRLASSVLNSSKIFTFTINDSGVVTATDTDGVAYTFTGTAVT